MVSRVLAVIDALETDPFPRGCSKLVGSERTYRVRVADWRIVYDVDTDVRAVLVHYVRHRRDAYRGR